MDMENIEVTRPEDKRISTDNINELIIKTIHEIEDELSKLPDGQYRYVVKIRYNNIPEWCLNTIIEKYLQAGWRKANWSYSFVGSVINSIKVTLSM